MNDLPTPRNESSRSGKTRFKNNDSDLAISKVLQDKGALTPKEQLAFELYIEQITGSDTDDVRCDKATLTAARQKAESFLALYGVPRTTSHTSNESPGLDI